MGLVAPIILKSAVVESFGYNSDHGFCGRVFIGATKTTCRD